MSEQRFSLYMFLGPVTNGEDVDKKKFAKQKDSYNVSQEVF